MRSLMRMGLLMVLAVMAITFLTSDVYAQPIPQPQPQPVTQPALPSCENYAGLTHRMAGCIRDTVKNSATRFFDQFSPMLSKAIGATLTLGIIVYGIMLSFGMVEKVGRDTMMLLFKISAVAFFTANSAMIYTMVTDMMDGAASAVVTYTPPSSVKIDGETQVSQTVCMNSMLENMANNSSKPALIPWLGIDCMLDTIIGIKVAPKQNAVPEAFGGQWYNKKYDATNPPESNPGMARGLIFFFTSSMTTSIVGAVLAVIGFGFIFSLLLLIVRLFFIYMMGYLAVAFLCIISPLVIPLLMFPQTKQYFDKWVKLLISVALQPVLSLVFVIFSLTVMDLVVYSGNYSLVYRIAGKESRKTNFDLNRYLTLYRDTTTGLPDANQDNPSASSKMIIYVETKQVAQVTADNPTPPSPEGKLIGGMFPDVLLSLCKPTSIKNDTSGALAKACNTFFPVGIQTKAIDWQLMAKARGAQPNEPAVLMPDGSTPPDDAALEQQMFNQVLSSTFLIGFVALMLGGFSKLVPSITLDLIGDKMQTPDLMATFKGGAGAIMDTAKNTFSNLQNGLRGKM